MAKRNREQRARQPETSRLRERARTLPLFLLGALVATGVAGWLLFSGSQGSQDPPDVILVTIDTLRADALGFAGNRRVETPFLDGLAREGVVYTNAHAHNVVTLPSHVNILTGLYPYQHGVRDNAGFTLDARFKTVATMLRDRGYATGAFIGAFPLDARFGLNHGFDVYDDKYHEGENQLSFEMQERPASEVLESATTWFQSNEGRKRFLWIHLYDPHAPYRPPREFAARYASAPYLGEVAATDAALKRFLQPIVEANPNLLTIITGDHGEALGDHGELTHGLFAYEATLKVPLLLHHRKRLKPGREPRYVRHVDIVPTILERVGAPTPPELPGRSLFRISSSRDTYFESLSTSLNRGWAPLVGMIHGDHKYIDLPIPELYDLDSDPAESKNLHSADRRSVFRIRELLAAAAPSLEPGARTISPEEKGKLLSLGYISGQAARKDYTEADDPKNLIELDNQLHKIVEFYQLGQLEASLAIATEVVRARPDMAFGHEMLAFVLHQNERTGEAVATLRRSIAAGQATDSMKIRLGLILSETGHAREALELLEPFASRNDPEMLNAYGIALADVGRLEEAVRQFDRILAVDPNNAKAFQNLGVVALRAGDGERARQYLTKALELNDRLPLALNTLGVVFAREGKYDQAIEAWSRAVAADPKLFDALFNLGIVGRQVGRIDVARPALARFIEQAPPQRYARDIAAARQILRQLGE